MELSGRLEILFVRVRDAPMVRTADEALALVAMLTEEVEAEFCQVPQMNPPPLEPTGRMYPPHPDNIRHREDGSIVARTRHHRIRCGADGSITIEQVKTRSIEVSKPGAGL